MAAIDRRLDGMVVQQHEKKAREAFSPDLRISP